MIRNPRFGVQIQLDVVHNLNPISLTRISIVSSVLILSFHHRIAPKWSLISECVTISLLFPDLCHASALSVVCLQEICERWIRKTVLGRRVISYNNPNCEH